MILGIIPSVTINTAISGDVNMVRMPTVDTAYDTQPNNTQVIKYVKITTNMIFEFFIMNICFLYV
jgi:hypothetical protein